MTQSLLSHWPDFLFLLLLQFAAVVVLRTFPRIIGEGALKFLDHHNAVHLERLKNELAQTTAKDIENLRADYSALRTSTDYLSANQGELRARTVAASLLLWNTMVIQRRELGGVVNLETLFVPHELVEMYEQGKHQKAKQSFSEWANEKSTIEKMNRSISDEVESARLFVGDRLWLIFWVFRAVVSRAAYMTTRSFNEGKYMNWRTDKHTLGLLRLVVPESDLQAVLQSATPGLAGLVGNIEAHFMKEATRIMSGSKMLADYLSDVQATIAYETMRVREPKDFQVA
jgi:hypothetical protein